MNGDRAGHGPGGASTRASDAARPGARTDPGGRVQLTLAELARFVDHRQHLASVDADSLARSVRLAVEYGVGAITCRPEDVGTVAAHVRRLEPDLGVRWRDDGQPAHPPSSRTPLVGVATALEFEHRAGSVEDLLREARDLTLAGATELALFVDEERLPVGSAEAGAGQRRPVSFLSPSAPRQWRDAVTALAEAQPRYRFRLRVHLETSDLPDDAVRRACEALRDSGVWMVQGGTWRGPRTSFHQVRIMREALGEGVRLKWTSPVSSLHGMLLAIAEGVDRFNAEDTFALLRRAERHARHGPLRLSRPGLDH